MKRLTIPQRRVLLGLLCLSVAGLVGFHLWRGADPSPRLAGGRSESRERTSQQRAAATTLAAGPTLPVEQRATQQLLLTMRDEQLDLQALAEELGVAPENLFRPSGTQVVIVTVTDNERREQIRTRVQALPAVASVEDDEPLFITATPNDPEYPGQAAALEQVRAPEAWDYVQGKSTATIAIIDTGVDGTHSDLSSKVLAGKNTITDASLSAGADSDDNGHGTNVAGVAAAAGNNGVGVAGVDWRAQVVPIKAFDSSGSATTSDVIEAISYAVDAGAHVISMSFGRSTESAALTAAIDSAWSRGLVLVSASGNDATSSVSFPAANEHVIAVGSVASSDTRSSFSNYGGGLDLMAPGESIYTTKDGGGYKTISGTSLATPFVAGAVTVAKDFHSSAGNQEIVDLLLGTGRQVGGTRNGQRTDEYGWGILDLHAAITSAGNYQGQVVSWSSSDGEATYPSLTGLDAKSITIRYRNTGRTRWFRGIVNLGTVDANYAFTFNTYALASNWLSANRPATLTEASVAPGETGTFTFSVRNPGSVSGGSHRLDVGLVADGITWFPRLTHAYWSITTSAPYDGQVVSWSSSAGPSAYPTLGAGQSSTITIRYRNTGSATWQQGVVNLGTVDANYAFTFNTYALASNWLSANRPATLTEASVAPGETGTFTFSVRNPGSVSGGSHRLDVGLVADGITWFPRLTHAYWDVTAS